MKKKYLFIGLFLCLFTFFSSAQKDAATESQRLVTLFQKLEGTYQIQIIDSRDKIEIPLVLMDSIQAKRNIKDVVYFPLKPNVRVMVLPFSTINDKDFKRLERVVNISSQTANSVK